MLSSTVQKQPPEVFCKKSVLKNFAKFTRKHLCQRLFFNKVAGAADHVWATASYHRQIMLTIYFFRSYLEADYFPSSDKRLNIGFRNSRAQLQKLRKDDSNLVFHLNLKPATTKKTKTGSFSLFPRRKGEYLCICTDKRLTTKYKIYSIAEEKGISNSTLKHEQCIKEDE